MVLIIPWWVLEMGMVSQPILEIMERTVVVWNQIWMSFVTEPPIKTGVNSAELREGEGVPGLESMDSICFHGNGSFFCV